MSAVVPNVSPRRPWLAGWLGLLAATYVATWHIELYLYVIAIMAGTAVFSVAVLTTLIARLARRERPLLDRREVVVVALGAPVHLAAWAMLRTVEWD